jgi:hypothetical protein
MPRKNSRNSNEQISDGEVNQQVTRTTMKELFLQENAKRQDVANNDYKGFQDKCSRPEMLFTFGKKFHYVFRWLIYITVSCIVVLCPN